MSGKKLTAREVVRELCCLYRCHRLSIEFVQEALPLGTPVGEVGQRSFGAHEGRGVCLRPEEIAVAVNRPCCDVLDDVERAKAIIVEIGGLLALRESLVFVEEFEFLRQLIELTFAGHGVKFGPRGILEVLRVVGERELPASIPPLLFSDGDDQKRYAVGIARILEWSRWPDEHKDWLDEAAKRRRPSSYRAELNNFFERTDMTCAAWLPTPHPMPAGMIF